MQSRWTAVEQLAQLLETRHPRDVALDRRAARYAIPNPAAKTAAPTHRLVVKPIVKEASQMREYLEGDARNKAAQGILTNPVIPMVSAVCVRGIPEERGVVDSRATSRQEV
jgi:hypothetical protein